MTRFGTKDTLGAAALLLASTSLASAGGLDRTGLSIAPLFEDGSYAEINLGYVMPDITGFLGAPSGDVASDFLTYSLAYKQDLSDNLSFAFIFEEAFGAAVDYTNASAAYPLIVGLGGNSFEAQLSGTSLSGILRYEFNDRFSVHGGLRYVTMSGEINFDDVPQTLTFEGDSDLGYLIGVAYEIPDIALRASLTYYSETEHNHPITNSLPFDVGLGPLAATTGAYVLPQSVNLDFQTGIAEGTLLLASVRWAEWTETAINTQSALGIIDYDTDVWTWSAGIARRLNEDLALVGRVTFEEANGFLQSNLDPKDGRLGLSLAAIYDIGDIRLTGGINYTHLGDATTTTINAPFTDNHAVGFGLRVGYSF